jgi:hypothetical protein
MEHAYSSRNQAATVVCWSWSVFSQPLGASLMRSYSTVAAQQSSKLNHCCGNFHIP